MHIPLTFLVILLKQVKGLKKDLGEYEVLRNIVSDADKLEAIGEVGVLRCYQYTMESQPHLSTQQVEFSSSATSV